jgi:uncharacterized protein (DUF924 family)
MMNRSEAILDYWFQDLNDCIAVDLALPHVKRWFSGDEATDREIRERFEKDHLRAAQGEYKGWEDTPRGRLALVILLDQIPRNLYRGSPEAFASDPMALDLCLESMEAGHDEPLALIERAFLYMPLMHAESVEMQDKCKEQFSILVELAKERSPMNVGYFTYSHEFAVKHAVIIERFGRFPHRNAILGRPSTQEEIEFLKEPDSSF